MTEWVSEVVGSDKDIVVSQVVGSDKVGLRRHKHLQMERPSVAAQSRSDKAHRLCHDDVPIPRLHPNICRGWLLISHTTILVHKRDFSVI